MTWPFTNTNYPTVAFPTILEGKIYGSKLRLESLDGSEMYLLPTETATWRGDHFHLENMGSLSIDGKPWGVTHLQKYSSRGWLKVSPDCYHQWYFWKPQEQNQKGDWIPDSERGIYFRRPFSWRWDIAGTNLDGALRHWVWTKGYIGGHWD